MKKNFIINSVLFGALFALLMMLPVSGVFAQGSTTAALAGNVVDEKGHDGQRVDDGQQGD